MSAITKAVERLVRRILERNGGTCDRLDHDLIDWMEREDDRISAAAPHLVAAVPDAAVEAAVLAEREECAKLAEDTERVRTIPAYETAGVDDDGCPFTYTVPEEKRRTIAGGRQIAKAIRARSAAPLPTGSWI